MDVSFETLVSTIGALSDEELLKRWRSREFTETAQPVAEAEIKRRGLDTSAANVESILAEEVANFRSLKSQKYINGLSTLLVLAACGGFIQFGFLPVVAVGLVALPISKVVGTWIDRRFQVMPARIALAVIAFVAMLLISTVTGLLVRSALRPGAKDTAAVDTPHRSSAITEADLHRIVEIQNRTNPAKMSDVLELTRKAWSASTPMRRT